MIEGLKVTIVAAELRALCEKQAQFHDERAAKYSENVKNLQNAEIEGMAYTGGDPKKALRDKLTQHQNAAAELRFIGTHLVDAESYLLDGGALQKLGIMRNPYGL